MAKKQSAASRKKHRASWRGDLTFGLVSVPVEAFNALNREQSDIHFHQLHAKCHRRIKYEKICPVHGPVLQDEIVSGFEYRQGKYIEVSSEELDAIKTKKDRALTIDAFIAPETIDPLYFDGRMYYLLPQGEHAEESYAVMVEAMVKTNRYAVGKIVLSGKEQLALVRPLQSVLHMAMLNYDEEIRPPESMQAAVKRGAGFRRQITLAQALVKNWFQEEFDFAKYDDEYRERVEKMIKAKVAGHEIVKPGEEEEEPEVINLMEALKKSLEPDEKPRRKTRKSRRKKTA